MYIDVDTVVSKDAGFSLLEMLIALAIMSLTSLALFQSMSRMLYVSDRAIEVSEQSLESAVSNRTITKLIDGLVPAWSLRPEDSFTGQRQRFSGVSANAIHSTATENADFTLSLSVVDDEKGRLIYEAQNLSWVLATKLEETAYFEYLDKKNIWHPQWPPVKPIQTPTDIALIELELVKLPQAIRLLAVSYTHLTLPTTPYV